MRVLLGMLFLALFRDTAGALLAVKSTNAGLSDALVSDSLSIPKRELSLTPTEDSNEGRQLTVTAVAASDKVPKRKLALFSSDEKTREIHNLRKGIVNSEGLIRQYQGALTR